MKVDFPNLKDKVLCESTKNLTRAFGTENAKKLRARLDDLDAASSMEDMRNLPGRWEELQGRRAGQFSARLHGGYRLIVRPQTEPPPVKADGGLDWRAIDSIYIVEVVDYHD